MFSLFYILPSFSFDPPGLFFQKSGSDFFLTLRLSNFVQKKKKKEKKQRTDKPFLRFYVANGRTVKLRHIHRHRTLARADVQQDNFFKNTIKAFHDFKIKQKSV